MINIKISLIIFTFLFISCHKEKETPLDRTYYIGIWNMSEVESFNPFPPPTTLSFYNSGNIEFKNDSTGIWNSYFGSPEAFTYIFEDTIIKFSFNGNRVDYRILETNNNDFMYIHEVIRQKLPPIYGIPFDQDGGLKLKLIKN